VVGRPPAWNDACSRTFSSQPEVRYYLIRRNDDGELGRRRAQE
jgi:hypothetical protein